ncbi:MAG: hypothetical protein IT384_05940 [Deltaproteobacteria bacterium]|nr:hypothetical protein [Deltaproteobacteria bacterium]
MEVKRPTFTPRARPATRRWWWACLSFIGGAAAVAVGTAEGQTTEDIRVELTVGTFDPPIPAELEGVIPPDRLTPTGKGLVSPGGERPLVRLRRR